MNRLKIIVAVVLAVVLLVIIAQNTDSVETQLLFVTLTLPRAVLLLLCMLIGFVVGLLTAFPKRSGRKKPAD
ncbi:MAG: LapA family protein [Planctomycetes bacterium]|nr:LapA family protein [Planctomycetota bacterium]